MQTFTLSQNMRISLHGVTIEDTATRIISYKQIISHLDEAFSNTDAPQADFILSMSEKNNNKFMKPGKTHFFSLNLIKLQNTCFNLFAMNGSYT